MTAKTLEAGFVQGLAESLGVAPEVVEILGQGPEQFDDLDSYVADLATGMLDELTPVNRVKALAAVGELVVEQRKATPAEAKEPELVGAMS